MKIRDLLLFSNTFNLKGLSYKLFLRIKNLGASFVLFGQWIKTFIFKKSDQFWYSNKILQNILKLLLSYDFREKLKIRGDLAEKKAAADSARYQGKQIDRDVQNTSRIKASFEHQRILGLERIPTRLLGSSFSNQIGHLAFGAGTRIKAIKLGLNSCRYVMLGSRPANKWFVQEYLSPYIPFIYLQEELLEILETLNSFLFEDLECIEINNIVFGAEAGATIIEEEWKKRHPNQSPLVLSEDDKNYGRSLLRDFGFEEVDWFVTFHFRNRENESHRNNSPEDYLRAIEKVLECGGHVFVIGDGANLQEWGKDRNFFDFGSLPVRDERLDLFLLAECKFMVGTSSGPIDVPPLFGRGVLWTNCTNLVMSRFHEHSIIIPKLRTKGERPTFDQFLTDIEEGIYENDSLPSWAIGFDLESNTSMAITSGVSEMIAGDWNRSYGNREKLIVDKIRIRNGNSVFPCRISNYFMESILSSYGTNPSTPISRYSTESQD